MAITEQALQSITDRASLHAFLHEALGWPVDPEDTFTYAGPQPAGQAADPVEVSQILPFGADDP